MSGARKVIAGALAFAVLVGATIWVGRALDREAQVKDREVREWCASVGWRLAGCPVVQGKEPALTPVVDRAGESRAIAAQIVAACKRAERARVYFQACDTIHGD